MIIIITITIIIIIYLFIYFWGGGVGAGGRGPNFDQIIQVRVLQDSSKETNSSKTFEEGGSQGRVGANGRVRRNLWGASQGRVGTQGMVRCRFKH